MIYTNTLSLRHPRGTAEQCSSSGIHTVCDTVTLRNSSVFNTDSCLRRNDTRLFLKYILPFLLLFLWVSPAMASGDEIDLPQEHWSFDGAFGTYDKAALQRGLKVYQNVCAACHSLKRVHYRNLSDLGYNEEQIKTIAREYTVPDLPNDEGEVLDRSARPSDPFVSPYPNDQAAKYANNGAFPPDLSLITKARAGGADYIYALMTGYHDAPEGTELLAGQYWNQYISGHVIAMPSPLSEGLVSYEDGSPETIDQYSKDVAHFLTWAAEPEMEHRKRMGIKVVLYLIVFAGVMYAVKKKIWANVRKP